MREWRLLGFFLMTFFMAVATLAFGTGGIGTNHSTSDSLTGTTWTLMALAGQAISLGPAVTLRFETDGALAGFDGCNHYWGAYSDDGYSLQIADKVASTRAACREPLAKHASDYIQALVLTTSYAIDGNQLSLRDVAGGEVALFEAGSQSLAGTSWNAIAYNNGKQAVVSVLGGTRITANFGDDGQLTGSAGCNQYFAEYLGADGAIAIGMLGAPRRFCAAPEGAMDQETRYLEALRSAATFRLEGDRLALRTTDGALAVNLVRDSAAAPTLVTNAESKIRFDLGRLNADGLQGPPDGLRALHYEYCIPDRPDTISEVIAVDPTLQIQRGSPGRVGCGQNQLLCLGITHQTNYRTVLEMLSEFPFVVEIREAFFE